MRYLSKYNEAREFSFGAGWDSNDDPMEKLDKINAPLKPVKKDATVLNYIKREDLSKAWERVKTNVTDLDKKGNRFKDVLNNPIGSNANFSGFYLQKYENDQEKSYSLGDLCVIFCLKNELEYTGGKKDKFRFTRRQNILDVLMSHPAYSGIKQAHRDTLKIMGLNDDSVNPDHRVSIFIGGPDIAGTTDDQLFVQISYSGIIHYIKFVDDQLSNPKIRKPYCSPHRLYQPVANAIRSGQIPMNRVRTNTSPLIRLRTLMDKNPTRRKSKNVDQDQFVSEFNLLVRSLIESGFKYKHLIKEAGEIDMLDAAKFKVSPEAMFYLMAISGNYKWVDLIEMKSKYFLYDETYGYFALSTKVLMPFFKYVLDKVDTIWELDDNDLSILYLLYDPKLLDTHVLKGKSSSRWIGIMFGTKNLLVPSLVANNKKAETRWLVDLVKNSTSDQKYDALNAFKQNLASCMSLIKSRFSSYNSRSSLIEKGKFQEEPDYDFFRSIIIEINQLDSNRLRETHKMD